MHTPNAPLTVRARAELQKPTALVLAGPQGCGKTILARMLAAERGTFTEARIGQLMHKAHLTRLLSALPQTVVLDDDFELRDVLRDERHRAALKQLIAAPRQVINDRGAMRHVRTPKLIFCTHDVDHMLGDTICERFSVVTLGIERGAA